MSVLNFWAFWCGPCMAELPVIARLSKETSGSGVRSDRRFTRPRSTSLLASQKRSFRWPFKPAVSKYEGSFETVWDSKEQNFSVRSGIRNIPVTFVADKEGIVRYRMVGFDPDNAYRKLKAVVDSLNGLSTMPR